MPRDAGADTLNSMTTHIERHPKMNAPTDTHTPTTPEHDVVPDYGTMNRELLAEKLASAYWNGPVNLRDKPSGVITSWLAAADVAIAELQGTS